MSIVELLRKFLPAEKVAEAEAELAAEEAAAVEAKAKTDAEAREAAKAMPAPLTTLDTLAEAARRHAARRTGNPDARPSPSADDFLRAAIDTGNGLVVAAARDELGL